MWWCVLWELYGTEFVGCCRNCGEQIGGVCCGSCREQIDVVCCGNCREQKLLCVVGILGNR